MALAALQKPGGSPSFSTMLLALPHCILQSSPTTCRQNLNLMVRVVADRIQNIELQIGALSQAASDIRHLRQ
jgi:hypothetical protein